MEVAAASTGGCFSLWELGISSSAITRDQTASRGGRARTGSPGMSPLIPRAGRRGRISSRAIVQAMKGAITDERSNHRPRPPLRHPRGISAILEQLSGVCSFRQIPAQPGLIPLPVSLILQSPPLPIPIPAEIPKARNRSENRFFCCRYNVWHRSPLSFRCSRD